MFANRQKNSMRWILHTSLVVCLVGDPWDPEMSEKGLKGLVRLAELKGLAGLLEQKVADGPVTSKKGYKKKL